MSKFLKLLIVVVLFSLGSQLLAQDVYDTPEEVDREISKQEQREMRQNLAQEKMNYEVEIGSTNAIIISIPAGVMFVGGLLLLFASYMKLKNYRIAQPDENIR